MRFFTRWGRAVLLAAVALAVCASTVFAQKTGTFTDKRDGQKYRTVRIGNHVWMAENLRYKIGDSWCYENDESKCRQYGRLYDWNMAKRACPTGWHLPSEEEWDGLVIEVGSSTGGKKLKATNGWDENGNGTDDYGFSALPGGYRYTDGSFDDAGREGYWWTATMSRSDVASLERLSRGINSVNYMGLRYNEDSVRDGGSERENSGMSVRCLGD
jgi:uncharacterized protein (TIGR02145 family)